MKLSKTQKEMLQHIVDGKVVFINKWASTPLCRDNSGFTCRLKIRFTGINRLEDAGYIVRIQQPGPNDEIDNLAITGAGAKALEESKC